MQELEIGDELKDHLREAWHVFVDVVAPARPQLHQYCLKLTGNIWDAEDLVQDTLAKSFAYLGRIDDPIRNPQAYLAKTANTLWLDSRRRRARADLMIKEVELLAANPKSEHTSELFDAGRSMLAALTGRQTAAILMKDVFGFTLAECAEALETTEGAIKSLLKRARDNVGERPTDFVAPNKVSGELVDAFVQLFNNADIEGLLDLVLDNATVGNVGTDTEWGHHGHRGPFNWFKGAICGHAEDWPEALRFDEQHAESVFFEGEPIAVVFRSRRGEEALESIIRLTETDGKISRLQAYSFSPETKAFVANALRLNVRSSGYRYPTPSPGKRFVDETT